MSRLLVGLTGGLAAGKSTAAYILARRGCTVVDADELVAELYEPGQPGAAAVGELFGEEMIDPRGAVHRDRLAAVVFAEPTARARLETVIHPLVRERFLHLTEGIDGIVVCEATLLAEAGWAEHFDLVVTVEAPAALRQKRAVARGMAPDQAERRLAAQGGEEARRVVATEVLVNDGSRSALETKVEALLRSWQSLMEPDEGEGVGA